MEGSKAGIPTSSQTEQAGFGSPDSRRGLLPAAAGADRRAYDRAVLLLGDLRPAGRREGACARWTEGLLAPSPEATELLLEAADAFEALGEPYHQALARFLRAAPRARALEPFREAAGRHGSGWELTPREREVAELGRHGYSAREMARLLGISVRTVEKHLEHVKRKLGASRKSELVRLLAEDPG